MFQTRHLSGPVIYQEKRGKLNYIWEPMLQKVKMLVTELFKKFNDPFLPIRFILLGLFH